jgi:hypothetical protein
VWCVEDSGELGRREEKLGKMMEKKDAICEDLL